MSTNETTVEEEQMVKEIPVEWWPDEEGLVAHLEVHRDEYDLARVMIYTMQDGEGSKNSYYLDRDAARRLALHLLVATEG